MSVKHIYFFFLLVVFYSCKKESEAPLPQANFFVEIKQCQNDTCAVYFFDNSINAVSRIWDFGNGNTSTLEVDSTIYLQNDNYIVTLKVRNADGVESVKSKNIIF